MLDFDRQEERIISYYKRLSVGFFGPIVDSYLDAFFPLKQYLMGSDMKILLKTWVCIIFMTTAIGYVVSLVSVAILSVILGFDFVTMAYFIVFVPVLVATSVFLIFYVYPIQKASSVRNSIDNNLPFALAHMNAIASSGIPPEFMFELITGFKEYGAVAHQASYVVRNIHTFGMSSVSAMKDVARRTPSRNFRQILEGIASTIEKGGNLTLYISEVSNQALFEYRIKREKHMKTLSTYADIYTALLVAAPLMMLSVIAIMGIIGGDIMGMGPQELITVITWVALPILNIAFLTFLHITYPEM